VCWEAIINAILKLRDWRIGGEGEGKSGGEVQSWEGRQKNVDGW
jgi:hypothetical protein